MVHGGPFSCNNCITINIRGTNAIKRFARPICFQDYPQALLKALQNDNPLDLWRLVNGAFANNNISIQKSP
jgi:NADP-dependent aldehyde dehydrogenase